MYKTRKKHIPISYFHCPDCGNIMPLPRVHKQREKGHIKDLFCPYCKDMRKMIEQREFDFIETN